MQYGIITLVLRHANTLNTNTLHDNVYKQREKKWVIHINRKKYITVISVAFLKLILVINMETSKMLENEFISSKDNKFRPV